MIKRFFLVYDILLVGYFYKQWSSIFNIITALKTDVDWQYLSKILGIRIHAFYLKT